MELKIPSSVFFDLASKQVTMKVFVNSCLGLVCREDGPGFLLSIFWSQVGSCWGSAAVHQELGPYGEQGEQGAPCDVLAGMTSLVPWAVLLVL